jgi:hypothetical protein
MANTNPSAALVPVAPVFTNTERLAFSRVPGRGRTRHAGRARADLPAVNPPQTGAQLLSSISQAWSRTCQAQRRME